MTILYVAIAFLALVRSPASEAQPTMSNLLSASHGEYELSDGKIPTLPATDKSYFKELELFEKSYKKDFKKTEKMVHIINDESLCPEGVVDSNETKKVLTLGEFNGTAMLFAPIDGITYKNVVEDEPDQTDLPVASANAAKQTCQTTDRTHWDLVRHQIVSVRTQLCKIEDFVEQITIDFIKPDQIQMTRYYNVYDKIEKIKSPMRIICNLEKIAE